MRTVQPVGARLRLTKMKPHQHQEQYNMKMTDLGTLMYLISRGARSSILIMLCLQTVSTELTHSHNASGRIGAPNVTADNQGRCTRGERLRRAEGWLRRQGGGMSAPEGGRAAMQ